jgi:glucose dehydrogenase
MYRIMSAVLLSAELLFVPLAANANDDLIERSQNPKDWVIPAGNYASQRYSQLKQITARTSASCRWHGRSRPACCAATKAAR